MEALPAPLFWLSLGIAHHLENCRRAPRTVLTRIGALLQPRPPDVSQPFQTTGVTDLHEVVVNVIERSAGALRLHLLWTKPAESATYMYVCGVVPCSGPQ